MSENPDVSSVDSATVDTVPMSIATALLATRSLEQVSDSAYLDVQLLLAHVLDKPASYLYTWPEQLLTKQQSDELQALLAKRLVGEPIAYLLGYQDFWSLRLQVSKATLIPRPDTELLVELVLDLLPANASIKAADLGTGTGAIALAVASERPKWQIKASDYVDQAAALAEQNRQTLNIDNVEILTGSWFDPHVGKYHLIMSNPPYIDPADHHLKQGDVRFEPRSALISERAGLLDLHNIIEQAPEYLEAGGYLVLEHGYDQGESVRELLLKRGFKQVQTKQDLAANDRVSLGQWC
ncbi:peptide chain release factor N(5)-glutamine methyltransferase [Gammaproteobacteria bacterium AS21]